MQKKSLPPEAFQRYAAGEPVGALCRAYGVAHATFAARLREAGVERRPRYTRVPPTIPIDEVRRRYEAGESIQAIAPTVGLATTTLKHRMEEAGIQLRSLSEVRKLARPATILDPDELRRAYAEMRSMRGAAARLGTTEKVVLDNMERYGIPRGDRTARPDRSGFWSGGYTVDKHGYVLVRMPEHPEANRMGYVRIHRLVMERQLGRPLAPGEVVDHRDDDTSNNHPDNLRLFPSNGEHLRATRTGRARLFPDEREALRREAVLRALHRVDAILSGSGTDADPSLAWWPRPSMSPRTAPSGL
jgi:transposase-like protein